MDPGVDAQNTLPQWAVKVLVWVCVLVTGLFIGTYAWLFKDIVRRVKTLEDNEKNHASVVSVAEIEMRMAPLISRTELLAYLKEMREESDERFDQLREDRQRMHQENLDSGMQLRREIAANGEAVRSDIRSVHGRIDDVFKIGR